MQKKKQQQQERKETSIVGGDFLSQQQQQQQQQYDHEDKSIDSFTVDSILPDHCKPTSKLGRDIDIDDHNDNQVPVIAQAENKAVFCGKLVVLTVLLLSALAIALAIYYYTSHAEHTAFVQRFHQDSNKILEAIGSTLDISLGSIDSFLVVMASYAHASNMTWPFVTLVSLVLYVLDPIFNKLYEYHFSFF